MGPDALRGIQQGLGGGGLGPALIIFAVCSLCLLLLMLQIFVRQYRRRKRVERRWRRFQRKVARLRLSRAQRSLVGELARKQCPETPESVLEQLEVFEKALHHYLNPLVAHERRDEARRAAELAHGIRERLGFVDAPGRIYSSTRELRGGEGVVVCPGGGEDASRWAARVGAPREDVLELADLEGADEMRIGQEAEVEFTGQGRMFRFTAEVLDVDADSRRCWLLHTLDVRAVDSREHHRAEARGPVTLRADWETDEVARDGLLLNLSAGGAAVESGCYYEKDEKLVLRIRPADHVSEGAGTVADDQLELLGRILTVERGGRQRCIYRVEFMDVEPSTRQTLFRLVQRLELQARRAAV